MKTAYRCDGCVDQNGCQRDHTTCINWRPTKAWKEAHDKFVKREEARPLPPRAPSP